MYNNEHDYGDLRYAPRFVYPFRVLQRNAHHFKKPPIKWWLFYLLLSACVSSKLEKLKTVKNLELSNFLQLITILCILFYIRGFLLVLNHSDTWYRRRYLFEVF